MEMLEGKKLSDALEDELALALGSKDKAMALLKRKRLGKSWAQILKSFDDFLFLQCPFQ